MSHSLDLSDLSEGENKKYDTLVLSGGAHRGMILVGAMQYLMDNKCLDDITTYVGTSAGSMICYLLAIGYTPIEIMVYICTHRILERLLSFNLVAMIQGEGAISYTPIQETLEKMTLDKIGKFLTMKELKDTYNKTLICATYNNTRQTMEYIGPENYADLPCLIALRMSSNISVLFGKFKYLGFEYVDGGISDNFPVVEAEKLGNLILGVTLVPSKKECQEEKEKNFLEYLLDLMQVPIAQSTVFRISLATEKSRILQIPAKHTGLSGFSITSSAKLDMFSQGYQTTQKLF